MDPSYSLYMDCFFSKLSVETFSLVWFDYALLCFKYGVLQIQ